MRIALLMLGLSVFSAASAQSPAVSDAPAVDPSESLVRDAIDAAGGAEAIDANPVLAWTGKAVIHAGTEEIRIELDTVVEPDGRSLSRSWLAGTDPKKFRSLEITPGGGEMVRDGKSSELPESMWNHERIQYSIYQIMRLTPILRRDARLRPVSESRQGLRGLRVMRLDLPDALVWFDDAARIRQIELTAPDPETEAPIKEVVMLDGDIVGAGIHWPRSLKITMDGKPYFDLELKTFSPRQK